jgi:hypothetical protein
MKEESDPIKDMILESGLDEAEYTGVADALAFLRDVVPEQAPPPSAELAALLSGGLVTPLAPRRSRKRTIALASSAIAATLLIGTGVAAASNNLPEPAQRFFSHLSDKYLPFHIPSPDERGGPSAPNKAPLTPVSNQGKHLGQGDGSGKTGNPGQGTPTTNPGNGHDTTNNGNHLGQGDGSGKTDNPGQGTPTANPGNGKPTANPGNGKDKTNNGKNPPRPTPSPRATPTSSDGNAGGNGKGRGKSGG